MSEGTFSDFKAQISCLDSLSVHLLKSRGVHTLTLFSGETTQSILFSFPSEKRFTLKGKNLLPLGANSFLSE